MKFTYILSREEALTVNKLVCRRLAAATGKTKARWGLFALNVLAWLAIGYTSAAYTVLYKRNPELGSDLIQMLLALGAAVVLLVAGYVYKQKVLGEVVFSDASWARLTQSVSASAEGLDVVTTGASSHFDWSTFKEFMEDHMMLYLFLDISNVVAIPMSAFSTPEELAQFRSWVNATNR